MTNPNLEYTPIETPYKKETIKSALKALGRYNAQQWDAVTTDGNLYVTAVAGCGKTTTLSAILAKKVLEGIPPGQIAVSSFTVVASDEIANRGHKLISNLVTDTAVIFKKGTLHSLALQELKSWDYKDPHKKLLGEDEEIHFWMEAVSFLTGIKEKFEDVNPIFEVAKTYQLLRNMNLSNETTLFFVDSILNNKTLEIKTNKKPVIIDPRNLCETYQKLKIARNRIDYTDLLENWKELTQENEYKDRWKCILVDEFQDTSPLQQKILSNLSENGCEVILCGDPNQCITGFNGSDPKNQETLIKSLDATMISLTKNYRSHDEIIHLANDVLKQCKTQKLQEKEILLEGTKGPYNLSPSWNFMNVGDNQELFRKNNNFTVINEAKRMYSTLKEKGIESPQVAILYRSNLEGDSIEEACLNVLASEESAPPVIRLDRKKRAEIKKIEKELYNIIKWWNHPEGSKGDYLLKQILLSSYVKGIGKAAVSKIERLKNHEIKNSTTAWTSLQKVIPHKKAPLIGGFIAAWELAENHSQGDILTCKGTAKGLQRLMKWIRREEDPDKEISETRLATENNFIKSLEQYKDLELNKFLYKIEIAQENEHIRKAQEESFSGIILSTMHLSKGKEYDAVILNDISRGVLPSSRAIEDESFENLSYQGIKHVVEMHKQNKPTTEIISLIKELKTFDNGDKYNFFSKFPSMQIISPVEEEKRLLYVAITRAKNMISIPMRVVVNTIGDQPVPLSSYKHRFISEEFWDNIDSNTITIK